MQVVISGEFFVGAQPYLELIRYALVAVEIAGGVAGPDAKRGAAPRGQNGKTSKRDGGHHGVVPHI